MDTTEQDLINRLTQSIASAAVNPIPLDKRLWNADDCAQYLRMAKSTFQTHYAPHPKFPRPIKLDRAEGKSARLWKAGEVVEWALNRK